MGRTGTTDGDPALARSQRRSVRSERPKQLRPSEDGDRTAGSKEDAIWDLLLAADALRGDQCDANHCTNQVGREEPEQDVAPSEPAQRKAQHGGKPDIAEAQDPGAGEVHRVEHRKPGGSRESANQEIVPLTGDGS